MTQNSAPPYTLGILLFPGFPMACLTSCIEPAGGERDLGSGGISLDSHG